MDEPRTFWRLCSSCKKQLPFEAVYYACSVSTCNQKRNFMSFCSVFCWQSHVPIMRHRDAWAEKKRAPTREQWQRERANESQTADRSAAPPPTGNTDFQSQSRSRPESSSQRGPHSHARAPEPSTVGTTFELNSKDLPVDILIVASKLKRYIRARSGMNTSDAVMGALSDIVRTLCDQAIRHAAEDERKTVMDRDFSIRRLSLELPARTR